MVSFYKGMIFLAKGERQPYFFHKKMASALLTFHFRYFYKQNVKLKTTFICFLISFYLYLHIVKGDSGDIFGYR